MLRRREGRMKKERSDTRETRRRILWAASEVFAEKGFWEATSADICMKANANSAAVNYHFGSKENLWRACADQLFNAYNAAMARRRESLQGLDEPIILHLMLREFVSYMVAVPHFQQFLVLANLGDKAKAFHGAYGVSKRAVHELAGLFAQECPDVNVLAIDPGPMRTALRQSTHYAENPELLPDPEQKAIKIAKFLEERGAAQ